MLQFAFDSVDKTLCFETQGDHPLYCCDCHELVTFDEEDGRCLHQNPQSTCTFLDPERVTHAQLCSAAKYNLLHCFMDSRYDKAVLRFQRLCETCKEWFIVEPRPEKKKDGEGAEGEEEKSDKGLEQKDEPDEDADVNTYPLRIATDCPVSHNPNIKCDIALYTDDCLYPRLACQLIRPTDPPVIPTCQEADHDVESLFFFPEPWIYIDPKQFLECIAQWNTMRRHRQRCLEDQEERPDDAHHPSWNKLAPERLVVTCNRTRERCTQCVLTDILQSAIENKYHFLCKRIALVAKPNYPPTTTYISFPSDYDGTDPLISVLVQCDKNFTDEEKQTIDSFQILTLEHLLRHPDIHPNDKRRTRECFRSVYECFVQTGLEPAYGDNLIQMGEFGIIIRVLPNRVIKYTQGIGRRNVEEIFQTNLIRRAMQSLPEHPPTLEESIAAAIAAFGSGSGSIGSGEASAASAIPPLVCA